MILNSHCGTFITIKILIIMLWLTLLKAFDQSAKRLMMAVGLFGLSVSFRMKLMMEIRAWEHDDPGTAYCEGYRRAVP